MLFDFPVQEIEAIYQKYEVDRMAPYVDRSMLLLNGSVLLTWIFQAESGQMNASTRSKIACRLYVLVLALHCFCLHGRALHWYTKQRVTIAVFFRLVYTVLGGYSAFDALHLQSMQKGWSLLFWWLYGSGCIPLVFQSLNVPLSLTMHVHVQLAMLPFFGSAALLALKSRVANDGLGKCLCMHLWSKLERFGAQLEQWDGYPLPCHAVLITSHLYVGLFLPGILLYLNDAKVRSLYVKRLLASEELLPDQRMSMQKYHDWVTSYQTVIVTPFVLSLLSWSAMWEIVKLVIAIYSVLVGNNLTVSNAEWSTYTQVCSA